MKSKNAIFVPALLIFFLVLFFVNDIQSVQKGNTNQKLHYVSQSVYVELLADCSMNSYTISKSINISEQPLYEYTFMSSINTLEKVLDEEGNELEYSVRCEPNVYVFTVQLRKSVKPDEELVIKTVDKNRKAYQRQDGIYMYSKKHIPGPDIQYTEEIKIHPDLQLIAFVPSPSQKLKKINQLYWPITMNLKKERLSLSGFYLSRKIRRIKI